MLFGSRNLLEIRSSANESKRAQDEVDTAYELQQRTFCVNRSF